jgi:hypothetical protein
MPGQPLRAREKTIIVEWPADALGGTQTLKRIALQ